MNSFTHSFAFFPCLEVVIIVFKDYYGIDVQEFMTEYARKWFQKCPTLVHIDLPQCGKRLEKRKPLPVSSKPPPCQNAASDTNTLLLVLSPLNHRFQNLELSLTRGCASCEAFALAGQGKAGAALPVTWSPRRT